MHMTPKPLPAFLLLTLLLWISAPPAQAGDGTTVPTTPVLQDGGKWRIGYYEGGQYPDYEVVLKAIVRGLVDLGWMEPLDDPPETDARPGAYWRHLAANAVSDYLEFPADAYYTDGNFDHLQREPVRERLIGRLAGKGDIDLMIAMGTWAGQDLANDRHHTPVVVASTSDPIGAGIVPSAENSGRPHVHAKVEPDRYARQVELFHDIIGFRSLGLVYEDSREGRTFAAVDAIARIGAERGFAIEGCLAPFNDVSEEKAERAVVDCYREVAGKADAVYLTVHRGLSERTLPQVVLLLNRAGRPSFSMLGESEVRRGALMSVAQGNYTHVGHFHAEVIGRVFNGARPGDLPQAWLAPAKIALNLRTAERIGYDPPVDILMASDEIYQEIEADVD